MIFPCLNILEDMFRVARQPSCVGVLDAASLGIGCHGRIFGARREFVIDVAGPRWRVFLRAALAFGRRGLAAG